MLLLYDFQWNGHNTFVKSQMGSKQDNIFTSWQYGTVGLGSLNYIISKYVPLYDR